MRRYRAQEYRRELTTENTEDTEDTDKKRGPIHAATTHTCFLTHPLLLYGHSSRVLKRGFTRRELVIVIAASWQDDSGLAEAWGHEFTSEYDDCAPASARQRRPQRFTTHARKRASRRNVERDAAEYVLTHGRMIQRTGVTFYFLGWRDIPPADRRASWAARLEGTTVLVAPDGEVITVYRNRSALRPIMRKLKYRLPELDRRLVAANTALAMVEMDQAIA